MPNDEINNIPEEPEEEQETEQEESQEPGKPDPAKYPHGVKEQPIGQWWNPDPGEQYVETPIGGHVFPEKSRKAAGME